MLKQPIHWFFDRLGLGMALANGGARAVSRDHLACRYLEDEMLHRYLGAEHFHESL